MCVLSFLLVATNTHVVEAANSSNDFDLNLSADNYYSVYNEWLVDGLTPSREKIGITPDVFTGGVTYGQDKNYGYHSDVSYLQPGDKVTFEVNAPKAGLYQIYYDYFVLPESRLTPSFGLLVNGEQQYNEMNSIDVAVDWAMDNEIYYDRFGDQLAPKSILVEQWKYEIGMLDPNRFYYEPLYFNLKAGINEVEIEVNEGYLLLGDIRFETREEKILTYDEYIQAIDKPYKSLKQLIPIEAEDMDSKSRRGITSKYKRDPGVTPYAYKTRVYNILDGDSFSFAGDKVTYNFTVEESGFYNIALKYYLNLNSGIPSHRRILIDGKVPFKELERYRFEYQTKWKNVVLSDAKGKPFEVYLEAGEHTLSLEIDDVAVRDMYHQLLDILQRIDSIALEINSLTGGLTDSGKRREWNLTEYIPTLKSDLQEISKDIARIRQDIVDYTGSGRLGISTELKIAKELIDKLAKDPNKIPEYMERFNQGYGSAYGRINTILPQLTSSPLSIDTLYLTNGVKLPKANANFFVRFIESVKAFFYSFFDPKYNKSDVIDDDTIEVWVNKSRLYVEIMQRKIDEEFTKKTGIKVVLSLMPDENKIVLANAAGTTPDAAIGISMGRPFELAIRGVLEDVRQLDGFYELAEQFNPNSFIPYIYEEGVFAVPETQGVNMLYYRTDIFDRLGLTAPDTQQDVVNILPTLQKYNMNYFHPLGNDSSYKGFGQTGPFIYQFGGDFFNPETMTTIVNREGSFDAFEFMTDLYTVYNLPTSTPNFFEHFRNGKIPVGVADQNMYIQLKYAAPEIAGQWAVLPIPGVMGEDGIVKRYDPAFGSSSIVFSDSKKSDKAWELVKWWSSADVQADFSYEIQAVLGDRFLYMTANLDGFKESAWPSDSKGQIIEQWQWIRATGKVPGDYILEREISNAYNKVVFDNITPRVAIDESIMIINRELHRKLEEFGYMDDKGNILKKYQIPTTDNVERWVRRNEKN